MARRVARVGLLPPSFLPRVPHLTIILTAPAAMSKPAKNEDSSVGLENLFDDFNDSSPKLKEDVKENLPVLEKPGSWESKVVRGGR